MPLIPSKWPLLVDGDDGDGEEDARVDEDDPTLDQEEEEELEQEFGEGKLVQALSAIVRQFLGYHLVTQFDSDDRQYFEVAPKLVSRFLAHLKSRRVVVPSDDFRLANKIAKQASVELSKCKDLAMALPGARNFVYRHRFELHTAPERILDICAIDHPEVSRSKTQMYLAEVRFQPNPPPHLVLTPTQLQTNIVLPLLFYPRRTQAPKG